MTAETLMTEMQPYLEGLVQENAMVAHMRHGQVSADQIQRLVISEFQCQEVELPACSALVSRYRHETPAAHFSLLAHKVAQARGLLREAATAVGLDADGLAPDPADGRQHRAMRLLSWLGPHARPAEAALYMHADLVAWCAIFAQLATACDGRKDVPPAVLAYLRSWGAEPASDITGGTVRVVNWGLSQGESADRALRTARHVEDVLTGYWSYVTEG
ncbi:hypothetical protein [Streptomyces qinglanensis]|uniref:hypothetical protein n=1 Tax=Streptomyces qinglanensis TaxID=943816 RepID=UPI003D73B6F2